MRGDRSDRAGPLLPRAGAEGHPVRTRQGTPDESAFVALAVATAFAAPPALAEVGADLGVLTCKLQDVHNDIVYTSEKFGCDFKPHSGAAQSYTGEIKAVGVDLSVTKDMTLVWGVFAPTADAGSPEALKGRYLGASADVAVGAGAGANVLVGGGHKSITLQPISASGIVGTGASVDIEEFELH